MPADLSRQQRPYYRAAAAALVVGSGMVIFLLGICLQVVLYDYRDACREIGSKLPAVTAGFFSLFVVRPSWRFTYVVWWFWWPMLWCFLHAHARCPGNAAFAIRFGYGFATCWLLLAMFLAVVGVVCAMPRVILLADLRATAPATETLIRIVNWILPAATFVATTWWAWRRHRTTSGPRGFEVISRHPAVPPGAPEEGVGRATAAATQPLDVAS